MLKHRSTATALACLSLVSTLSSLSLVGCGGDSGPAAPVVPPPTVLSLSGTAAQGAAMAGAAVSIKCASGAATATAGADGKYSASLSDASLPCVVRAVSADGLRSFHSVVGGSGAATASYVVNVTPLTDLLVANLASAAPDSYFTSFGATTTLTPTAVTQAVSHLVATLAGVVDLSGVDPIADPLTAANGSTAGNTLDQKLDALSAALTAAQTTLADLTAAVAANPVAVDPVKRLVQPVATGCAWLRSGKFRMISPFEQDPAWRAHVMQLNAATLVATTFDGAQVTLTPDPQHACSFTVPGDAGSTVRFMVSSAGVIAGAVQGSVPLTFGLPEQTLPLADFAGSWNLIRTESLIDGSGKVSIPTEVTVDANGQITAFAECPSSAACTPDVAPFPTLRANAEGGFDLVDGGVVTDRVYLYKTEAGSKMMVTLSSDGKDFNIGTPKKTTALPAAGASNSFWDYSLSGKLALGAPVFETQNIISVDSEGQKYKRIFTVAEGSLLNRVDTFAINNPRDGWRLRAQGGCTLDDAPVNCLGVFVLPLQGMGITLNTNIAATTATNSRIGLSVGTP